MSKKYALLVGVDQYLNDPDKIRISKEGKTVTLKNLQGCVHDAESIKNVLESAYQFDEVVTLLAPLPMFGHTPVSSNRLPTFRNIKDRFMAVEAKAKEGDFFFFHFSGHGALIDTVAKSPEGRIKDPSLMTMDFCCKQPAVHDKAASIPETRASEVEISWSMSPKAFTLMTACQANEKALEVLLDGRVRGAFTSGLLKYLEDSQYQVNYRMIQDYLKANLKKQKPTVYGRDRYLFLGNSEPFFVTPLNVSIEDKKAVIQAGRAHGVCEKAEFALSPAFPSLLLTIDHVEEFRSSAKISAEVEQALLSRVTKKAVSSRWSLGSETKVQVMLDTMFTAEFQDSLYKSLGSQLANQISIVQKHDAIQESRESTVFRLRGDGKSGIEILGPEVTAGHKDSVQSIKVAGLEDTKLEDLAVEAAFSIAHLARFSLISGLKASSTTNFKPFKVTLVPEDKSLGQGPYPPGTTLIYTFENTTAQQYLYFSVINLGHEFDIEQIYPTQDGLEAVMPEDKVELRVKIQKSKNQTDLGKQVHTTNNREVYRTLVSLQTDISWKAIELPRISDAFKWKTEKQWRGDDEPRVERKINTKWWMDDQEILVAHPEKIANGESDVREGPETETEKPPEKITNGESDVREEVPEIETEKPSEKVITNGCNKLPADPSSAPAGDSTIKFCAQMFLPVDLADRAVQTALKENPENIIYSPDIFVPPAGGIGRDALDEDGWRGGEGPDGSPRLGLFVRKMWANGRTLRVRFLSDPGSYIQGKVEKYAHVWSQYANLRFEFGQSEEAEIRISFKPGGSWSYMGTDALLVDANEPTMNYGWLSNQSAEEEFSRVVTHEFGHAIGCIHEHSQPNVNIQWNKPVVYEEYARSNRWTTKDVDANVFSRYNSTDVEATAFDPTSIMEYSIPKGFTTNGFTIGLNTRLSPTDIALIQQMYPKTVASAPDVANPFRIGVLNTLSDIHNGDGTDNDLMVHFSYASVPGFAVGFNFLDFDKPGNVQVKSVVKALLPSQALFGLEFEDDDIQHASGVSWFAFPSEDTDLQTGSHTTKRSDVEQRILFKHKYSSPPTVLVFFSTLDIKKSANCHVETLASNVTTDSFTLKIKSSIRVSEITVSWIALPPNKSGIAAGTISTKEIKSSGTSSATNKQGTVKFSPSLSKSPSIFLALSMLDIDRNAPTRVRLSSSNVSKSGMDWHIDSWGGSTLRAAAATYIAIDT
ncbi:hypothetical protein Trco_007496 [Trichoderma cornu-damae]|uniref:Peptidase metallopeptidase domain-containing protein n=1 Tax=Trichoderma cornu-damae TaxID=654480 RepID=A0A9P8QJC8_9HYPO|nr:hypothetical protein Trco_007496 [Trichoderma cornu-damae]